MHFYFSLLPLQNHNKVFKLSPLVTKMDDNKRVKMGIIAGASHALKFLKENKRATHEDAIEHVSDISDEIVEKIDRED
jgi:hypothetical protein